MSELFVPLPLLFKTKRVICKQAPGVVTISALEILRPDMHIGSIKMLEIPKSNDGSREIFGVETRRGISTFTIHFRTHHVAVGRCCFRTASYHGPFASHIRRMGESARRLRR